jgi:hypothetical protein
MTKSQTKPQQLMIKRATSQKYSTSTDYVVENLTEITHQPSAMLHSPIDEVSILPLLFSLLKETGGQVGH